MNRANIKISVVVPFFNEEKYIEKCANSLLNQEFNKEEYEVIFVNNRSTDKSEEILKKYQRITLVEESKQGSYAARNKGLSITKGKIIAFTDADCEVAANWLSSIYDQMKGKGSTIILGHRVFSQHDFFLMKAFEHYENSKTEYILKKRLKRNIFGYTNNMAVSTDLFRRFGNFIEINRGGDTEFINRCVSRSASLRVIYSPDSEIKHLEITATKDWLKKIYIYGQHGMKINRIHNFQSLDTVTKFRIYKFCLNKNNYTAVQGILFFLSLVVGEYAYRAGRIKGYLRH